MADTGRDRQPEAAKIRALRSIADLAGDGLAERMRIDAAARILTIARRAVTLKLDAAGPVEPIVSDLALRWDPSTTTATEYLEALSVQQLDAFLAAAPRWAASVRAANAELADQRRVA
ncbi:hypothetical protein G3576_19870 [Roseomonas stagni]|uniref:Uncharacterized protein n=1 Tax=Falsiroseomonas algicola TaxID=2716930 RepID=A0A6M1LPI9_9PROT|nr:hypothetical protein [Falsiroseomonas algicola]NGM22286.1 hypothetical protein [Falsiroseomonas algicola]